MMVLPPLRHTAPWMLGPLLLPLGLRPVGRRVLPLKVDLETDWLPENLCRIHTEEDSVIVVPQACAD